MLGSYHGSGAHVPQVAFGSHPPEFCVQSRCYSVAVCVRVCLRRQARVSVSREVRDVVNRQACLDEVRHEARAQVMPALVSGDACLRLGLAPPSVVEFVEGLTVCVGKDIALGRSNSVEALGDIAAYDLNEERRRGSDVLAPCFVIRVKVERVVGVPVDEMLPSCELNGSLALSV